MQYEYVCSIKQHYEKICELMLCILDSKQMQSVLVCCPGLEQYRRIHVVPPLGELVLSS